MTHCHEEADTRCHTMLDPMHTNRLVSPSCAQPPPWETHWKQQRELWTSPHFLVILLPRTFPFSFPWHNAVSHCSSSRIPQGCYRKQWKKHSLQSQVVPGQVSRRTSKVLGLRGISLPSDPWFPQLLLNGNKYINVELLWRLKEMIFI